MNAMKAIADIADKPWPMAEFFPHKKDMFFQIRS